MVSTVTRLQVGHPRNRGSIPADAGDLSLVENVQTGFGGHPASISVSVGVAFSTGVGWPWCETDHPIQFGD